MLAKSSFYAFRTNRPRDAAEDWQHPVVGSTGEALTLREAGQAAQAAFFQEVWMPSFERPPCPVGLAGLMAGLPALSGCAYSLSQQMHRAVPVGTGCYAHLSMRIGSAGDPKEGHRLRYNHVMSQYASAAAYLRAGHRRASGPGASYPSVTCKGPLTCG